MWSDGTSYETPRIWSTDAPTTWLQGGLYPGGTQQGWVPLQVPVGDGGVLVRFTPRGSGGETDQANTRYLGLGE